MYMDGRFLDFSTRKQAQRLMMTITDNSQATRSKVRKIIKKAIADVSLKYRALYRCSVF